MSANGSRMADLVRRLTVRWRDAAAGNGGSSQPVILAEDSGFAGRVRRYVIWDEWEGTRQEERSRVIQEACEQALGRDERLRTTVSMGLTTDEAARLGVTHAA